jgi:hypothetical protein
LQKSFFMSYDILTKHPEFNKLFYLIREEIQKAQRPAEEVIVDDVDLRNMLKVSKRTTATWRECRLIKYSKLGGKIYYRLADVLDLLKRNEIASIESSLKTRL